MEKKDFEKLCPGCMHELPPEEGVCPKCGWKRDGKNAPHQLPPGTLLGGKYYVGAALREDQNGITYIAYDIASGERLEVTEYYPQATATRREGGYNVSTMTRDESALAYLNTLPKRRETFLENGTAYAVTPMDMEEEKKRLDAWEAEKKARTEAERKKRESQEKQQKRLAVGKKVLGVLMLAACAAGVFFMARWGYDTLCKASFINDFLSGHEDLAETFLPLGIPAACAVLFMLFLFLAAAAGVAVFLLRGRLEKIWKYLGLSALFVAVVSCVVIVVGIKAGRVEMPPLIAEGETYTGEKALLAREVTDLGTVQACMAYQYDGQGRMVKEMSWVSTNLKRWTISTYAYNEQGDVIRREFSDDEAPEPDVTEYEYTYDEQGRMLTKTDSDGNTYSYEYSAAEDANPALGCDSYRWETEYDADGVKTRHDRYEYLDGDLVRMLEYGDGSNPDYIHEYSYAAGGVLSGETIYDGHVNLLAERYFDPEGNVVREDNYNNYGTVYQSTQYIYEKP